MKWILLIMVMHPSVSRPPGIAMHPFDSPESCNDAAVLVRKEAQRTHGFKRTQVLAVCLHDEGKQ